VCIFCRNKGYFSFEKVLTECYFVWYNELENKTKKEGNTHEVNEVGKGFI